MPFGKYNLRNPGARSSLGKARDRYNRLCGKVIIIQKADPDKLEAYRAKQRALRKKRTS